jgi:hypothetical protein
MVIRATDITLLKFLKLTSVHNVAIHIVRQNAYAKRKAQKHENENENDRLLNTNSPV